MVLFLLSSIVTEALRCCQLMFKESRNAGSGGRSTLGLLFVGRCGVKASLKEEVPAILEVYRPVFQASFSVILFSELCLFKELG